MNNQKTQTIKLINLTKDQDLEELLTAYKDESVLIIKDSENFNKDSTDKYFYLEKIKNLSQIEIWFHSNAKNREEVELAFGYGADKVIIEDLLLEDPDVTKDLLAVYPQSKICLYLQLDQDPALLASHENEEKEKTLDIINYYSGYRASNFIFNKTKNQSKLDSILAEFPDLNFYIAC